MTILPVVMMLCFIGLTMFGKPYAVMAQTETFNGGNGGSLRPVGHAPTNVRMVREDIKIDFTPSRSAGFRRDYYQVTVDSVFHNDGAAQKVTFGIPEIDEGLGEPFSAKKPGLTHVVLWVDSVRQPTRWTAVKHSPAAYAPSSVWVHAVSFVRGQSRRVRVKYCSVLTGECASGLYYKFADRMWHGRLTERSLTLVNLSRHDVTSYLPSTDDKDGLPHGSSRTDDIELGGKSHCFYHSWRIRKNLNILFIGAV